MARATTLKERGPTGVSGIRTSEAALLENTGRTWTQWFKLLDKWGAKNKKHSEIARYLLEDQGVDGWWAQTVTVAYEQERGMRAPGQRADGTYGVSASKTIDVPVKTLFEAFENPAARKRWLGGKKITIMTVRPDKSMTAAWEEGPTRLGVGFTSKGRGRSQVALAHEKIAGAKEAGELKAFWRDRLDRLKELLEN